MPEIAARHPSTSKVRGALPLGIAAVTLVLYLPVLVPLVKQWITDANYQHGLAVPFVSAFLLWRRRAELREAVGPGGGTAGLVVIAAACALLVAGTAAAELFTARLSLPLMLVGFALLFGGVRFTAAAALPLALLFMMVPLPYIIYYKITFPLQIASARLAAGALRILQVSVIRRGNILELPNYTLEVVAACSGLRSLMTMLTLSLVLAAFTRLGRIRTAILIAASVAAALAANTFRLVVTAFGAYAVSPAFADGALHEISGLIVFLAGLLVLGVVLGILRWVK